MSQKSQGCILIIDDDDVFRCRLARAFSDRGFEAIEVANGIDAYEYVNRKCIKYIVLDLKLKEESGLDVLKRLRVIDGDIKIVVLTGYGTIATTVEAVKLGAVNYLTKPVNADTVLAAFGDLAQTPASPLETPHLAQVEWDHIQRVVKDCDGNISYAAKTLGLHRRSLQRKLTKNPFQLK